MIFCTLGLNGGEKAGEYVFLRWDLRDSLAATRSPLIAISADLPRIGEKGTGEGSRYVDGAHIGFRGRGRVGADWADGVGAELVQNVSSRGGVLGVSEFELELLTESVSPASGFSSFSFFSSASWAEQAGGGGRVKVRKGAGTQAVLTLCSHLASPRSP